ncbi:DUF4034 domain-containing protein [Sedimenticola sp.]|uniref:DUF4034 domain-containing protein n=1 Tax=Sedimenticola sp. TaxID=1940285 RepID=UPI003D0DDA3A
MAKDCISQRSGVLRLLAGSLLFLSFVSGAYASATDPQGLVALLRAERFSELSVALGRFQAGYESDSDQEQALLDAVAVFDRADSTLSLPIKRWVEKHPDDYFAHLVHGIHQHANGWGWRSEQGRKPVQDWIQSLIRGYVPLVSHWFFRHQENIRQSYEIRLAKMRASFAAARESLERSLALAEKPIASYRYLVALTYGGVGRDRIDEWIAAVDHFDSDATSPVKVYSGLLRPRWGGSHDAMNELAQSLRDRNTPKWSSLADQIEADVFLDMGDEALWNGDRQTALEHFNRALSIHDSAQARYAIGRLYGQLGDLVAAGKHLLRGLELDPLDRHLHATLSLYYKQISDPISALIHLQIASELGHVVSMYSLSRAYHEGRFGASIDKVKGLFWERQAAYFWNVQALFVLAKRYEKGTDVPTDKVRALGYYETGAMLNCIECKNELGLMKWYGLGTAEDHAASARLWHDVASANKWQGAYNLTYFLSPWERLKTSWRYGPGMWAFWPILGVIGIAVGLLALTFSVARRRALAATSQKT